MGEYTYYIVGLPWSVKIVVTFFVTGTRFLTACFLTWSSARFLILSDSMTDVVLKAVSMQFVVSLDELLFRSFAPGVWRRKIVHTRFKFQGVMQSIWVQWMWSMSKM